MSPQLLLGAPRMRHLLERGHALLGPAVSPRTVRGLPDGTDLR